MAVSEAQKKAYAKYKLTHPDVIRLNNQRCQKRCYEKHKEYKSQYMKDYYQRRKREKQALVADKVNYV